MSIQSDGRNTRGSSHLATFDNLDDIPNIDDEDDIEILDPKTAESTTVPASVINSCSSPTDSAINVTENEIGVGSMEDTKQHIKNNEDHSEKSATTADTKQHIKNNEDHSEKSATTADFSRQEIDEELVMLAEEELSEISDNSRSEPLSDDKSASHSKDDEATVTHRFSFSLKDERKDEKSDAPSVASQEAAAEEQLPSQSSPGTKGKTKVRKSKTVKAVKDRRDSESSVVSTKKKGIGSKTQIKSKFAPGSLEYIDDRLCGRIFSGWVEERKWVDSVGGYRDVVEVDEYETEINQQLQAIVKCIPGVLTGSKWINVTPPSAADPCYSLWVLLADPPAPGHYWFSITGISVQPQFGLRISMKILRSIHPYDSEALEARRKRRKHLAASDSVSEFETVGEQLQEWLTQMRQMNFATAIWSTLSSVLTLSNIRETVRFLVVLVVTLVVGLYTFIRESHQFGLRFIREAGIFFRNITPFLQSVLSMMEKLVGGMYLLVAMVYRDWRRPSGPPPPPYPPSASSQLALGPGPRPPSPGGGGPRVLKYVPPDQWVYRNQNAPSGPN